MDGPCCFNAERGEAIRMVSRHLCLISVLARIRRRQLSLPASARARVGKDMDLRGDTLEDLTAQDDNEVLAKRKNAASERAQQEAARGIGKLAKADAMRRRSEWMFEQEAHLRNVLGRLLAPSPHRSYLHKNLIPLPPTVVCPQAN
jgi:hypothetical protein